jgi:hypothetical protein
MSDADFAKTIADALWMATPATLGPSSITVEEIVRDWLAPRVVRAIEVCTEVPTEENVRLRARALAALQEVAL